MDYGIENDDQGMDKLDGEDYSDVDEDDVRAL